MQSGPISSRPLQLVTVPIVGEPVMIGIGAIVKSGKERLQGAIEVVVAGLRLTLEPRRRPQLIPIPVVDNRRRGRSR